jgi:hypothetical protein
MGGEVGLAIDLVRSVAFGECGAQRGAGKACAYSIDLLDSRPLAPAHQIPGSRFHLNGSTRLILASGTGSSGDSVAISPLLSNSGRNMSFRMSFVSVKERHSLSMHEKRKKSECTRASSVKILSSISVGRCGLLGPNIEVSLWIIQRF